MAHSGTNTSWGTEQEKQGKCHHRGQHEVLQTKATSSQEKTTHSLQETAPSWAQLGVNPRPAAGRLLLHL